MVAIAGSVEEAADEFDKLAVTTPEKAAKVIVKAVKRNRRRATIGPDGRAVRPALPATRAAGPARHRPRRHPPPQR